MNRGIDRIVSQRLDGRWANRRTDADRASSLHDTQKEALGAAKGMLSHQRGEEIITRGADGKIRGENTIPPGNDSKYTQNTEH